MKFTITITNCLISSTFQKNPLQKKVEIKLITELDYKKKVFYILAQKNLHQLKKNTKTIWIDIKIPKKPKIIIRLTKSSKKCILAFKKIKKKKYRSKKILHSSPKLTTLIYKKILNFIFFGKKFKNFSEKNLKFFLKKKVTTSITTIFFLSPPS